MIAWMKLQDLDIICKKIYTFNALIDLPLAIASHSPGVEWPVFILMPPIIGDQAMFVIWLGAV